jgi:RNase P subunit RPR2
MNNPLSAYFRQPSLYIKLPSGGRHWPADSVNIPMTQELPVLSMTAGDEILLKTPDALINGQSTVSLIENCIPAIVDAWQTPITDMETILIAIRIASVGDTLSLEVACPKCREEHRYDVDLKNQLDHFTVSDWDRKLTVNDLTFEFWPINYQQQTEFSNRIFQHQKQMQQLNALENADEREQIASQIIADINQLETAFVIKSIRSVAVRGQLVREPAHIEEFVMNCEKKMYDQLHRHVIALRESTKCNQLTLKCDGCDHEFSTDFSLDYSSFFAPGS